MCEIITPCRERWQKNASVFRRAPPAYANSIPLAIKFLERTAASLKFPYQPHHLATFVPSHDATAHPPASRNRSTICAHRIQSGSSRSFPSDRFRRLLEFLHTRLEEQGTNNEVAHHQVSFQPSSHHKPTPILMMKTFTHYVSSFSN